MFETWGPRLGITEDENDHALREAWKAIRLFDQEMEKRARLQNEYDRIH